jgi:hypothetical protein
MRTLRSRSTERLLRCLVAGVAVAALAAMMACAATQPVVSRELRDAALAGLFRGFWHGMIAPIAFVVSLFSDHIRIYAVPNAGRWYDLGFMLGISGFSGGIFAGSRNCRPARNRRNEG